MSVQRAAWVGLIIAVAFVAGPVRQASALPPFFKEFQAKYVKAESADEKDKAFAATVTQTAKCNVCHAAGEDKKARNAYGKQLATILKKDNFKADRLKAEPEKCTAEIIAALDAVAAMKSGDDNSPTFGELIAQGKLPGAMQGGRGRTDADRARSRSTGACRHRQPLRPSPEVQSTRSARFKRSAAPSCPWR